MKKRRVIIVNQQDEPISYKERQAVTTDDIYRVSALFVTDSLGRILLAQRKLTKKNDPGKWGPAAAGTLEEGDTYDSNILQEAREEIGLTNIKPIKGPKHLITGTWTYFCQWYTLMVDERPASSFTIQEDEVEKLQWFTPAELRRDIREHPNRYLPGFDWAVQNLAAEPRQQ